MRSCLLVVALAWRALGQVSLALVSCLPNEIAPSPLQLVFDAGFAQFDQGQLAVGQKGSGVDFATRPTLWGAAGPISGTGNILRLVLTGRTGARQEGFSNITNFLAALVVDSDILTFSIGSNSSALCSAVRSPASNGAAEARNSGCPFGPGEVALGVSIPLEDSYPLATINTRLSVLDSSIPPVPLACYDLSLTPYYPTYFPYLVIHYFPIFLLASFAILYFLARLSGSYTDFVHESETQLASSLTLKLSGGASELKFRDKLGTVYFAGWAGKQLIGSGSLRRFCSPELRDVWNAIAWWTIVGLVAVQFPDFAYPVFAQYAWTTLVYNSTLPFVQSHPVNIVPPSFVPPSLYAAQMADRRSPLFFDAAVPNVLVDFGSSRNGIEKWARTIGIDASDIWGICAATFLITVAVLALLALLVFAVDAAFDVAKPEDPQERSAARVHPLQSTKKNYTGKESTGSTPMEDEHPHEGFTDGYGANGNAQSSPPSWLLHLSVFQGHLVRLLLIFHLPLSIFSIYQLSLYRTAPRSTVALAALFFAIVSVAIPAFLFFRIHASSRRQLFLNLPILLALGPLYNGYSEECTMFSGARFAGNLLLAIVIGGVQSNGTAQAAVILVVEVADTLVTSLYLPWAENSSMGPFAFLLSLSRIIIAICLIVLSPAVGVSRAAASWLAYVIFFVQGLIALVLFLVLVFKLVELLVRVIGKVPFDESRSPRAGGLFGALSRMDRGAIKKGRHRNSPSSKAAARRRLSNMAYSQSDGGNMDTFGSSSRMLNSNRSRNGHHSHDASSISAMTYTDSTSYPRASTPGSSRTEANDDFIMSAMSSGPWNAGSAGGGGYGNTSAGYIHPAAYSTVPQPMSPHFHHTQQYQPQLHDRSGSCGSESALTPTRSIGSTSGFSRVGGGRASSDNPYQVQPEQSYADYPPIPTTTALQMMNKHNRHSQSAIVELAGGDSPEHYPIPLPATSQLLCNTSAARYSIDPVPHVPQQSGSAKPKGLFARRWKSSKKDEDVSSEEDSEDEEKKSGVWSRLRRGKSSLSDIDQLAEPPIDKNQKSEFIVVRKPRPGISPASSSGTPKSGLSIALPPSTSASDPTFDAPHVSIEPPSR